MMEALVIRSVETKDIPTLCRLYNHYVQNTLASFEEMPVSVEDFSRRISSVTPRFPWLVYEGEGKVQGFAYANTWKYRSAYRHTLETTIYLDHQSCGEGIGSLLYEALIEALQDFNAHTLIACISLPNAPSVALHEKLGYEKIGHFREVGRKHDTWIDVGYWQRPLFQSA